MNETLNTEEAYERVKKDRGWIGGKKIVNGKEVCIDSPPIITGQAAVNLYRHFRERDSVQAKAISRSLCKVIR